MAIAEKIQLQVQELPPALQAEVLDFIEYLLARAERHENEEWSKLSLAFAMRGLEDEEGPDYTIDDLKAVFPLPIVA